MASGVVAVGLFGATWIAGVVGGIGASLGNDAVARVGTVSRMLLPTDGLWRGAMHAFQDPTALVEFGGPDGRGLPVPERGAADRHLPRVGRGVGGDGLGTGGGVLPAQGPLTGRRSRRRRRARRRPPACGRSPDARSAPRAPLPGGLVERAQLGAVGARRRRVELGARRGRVGAGVERGARDAQLAQARHARPGAQAGRGGAGVLAEHLGQRGVRLRRPPRERAGRVRQQDRVRQPVGGEAVADQRLRHHVVQAEAGAVERVARRAARRARARRERAPPGRSAPPAGAAGVVGDQRGDRVRGGRARALERVRQRVERAGDQLLAQAVRRRAPDRRRRPRSARAGCSPRRPRRAGARVSSPPRTGWWGPPAPAAPRAAATALATSITRPPPSATTRSAAAVCSSTAAASSGTSPLGTWCTAPAASAAAGSIAAARSVVSSR